MPILSEQLTHSEEEETMHSRPLRTYSIPHAQDGEDKADILYLISFYYSLHYSRTTYRLQVYPCGTNLIPNLEDSKLAMRIGHCRIRICWVSLTRLFCLYTPEIVWPAVMLFGSGAVYLASLYSFHTVQAAYKPFSQLPSCLASFQTV